MLPNISNPNLEITKEELYEVFRIKYGELSTTGWAPRMRFRFSYFSPDDYYETMVAKLVYEGCSWLDVGCGRNIFPSNRSLARLLADRCGLLVGVDPAETLEENVFVDRRIRSTIEDFQSDQPFDVVTLRMVAEHISHPEQVVIHLSRLTRAGGKVVIYTIYRWSPVPLLTRIIPFRFHHPLKLFLWGTEKKDTFPVTYQMNTREKLARLFEGSGFRECYFA